MAVYRMTFCDQLDSATESPLYSMTPTRTLVLDGLDTPTSSLTPVITSSQTPVTRKTHRSPMVVDEDSGLGMEFDSVPTKIDSKTCLDILTPSASFNEDRSICSRKSLFGQKRSLLLDGDIDGSNTKKQRHSGPRDQPRSRRFLKKSLSFGDAPVTPMTYEAQTEDIRDVVDRFVQQEDLIGNGSQSHSLPTIPGKHTDLKSISAETMVDLLTGRYDGVISSFRVIDCRYPYEFDGGHIKNAENLYTRPMVEELLTSRVASHQTGTRDILIFHCEFSSERGPKMNRHLRNLDRELNKDCYPFLNYPEVYLLHDGYKAFYETKQELCQPMSYLPMRHSSHADDLRHFRSKSKSWCAGEKRQRAQRLRF